MVCTESHATPSCAEGSSSGPGRTDYSERVSLVNVGMVWSLLGAVILAIGELWQVWSIISIISLVQPVVIPIAKRSRLVLPRAERFENATAACGVASAIAHDLKASSNDLQSP